MPDPAAVDTAKKTRKRNSGVWSAVLEYFNKHPNEVLYLKDIAADVGYPERAVQSAVSSLRYYDRAEAKTRLSIEVAGRAWIWHAGPADRLTPSPEVMSKVYSPVFQTASGTVLVTDAERNVYKLVPIDL